MTPAFLAGELAEGTGPPPGALEGLGIPGISGQRSRTGF